MFAPLVPILGYRAVLVLSGYVLNNVAFVAAAAYFYRYSSSDKLYCFRVHVDCHCFYALDEV